jgi:hypothetical protein
MRRCLTTFAGVLLVATPARAQERPVAIRDTPTAVIQRVSMRFPDAKIASVSTDTEEGKQLYEVTLKQNGRNIDVTTTPAGQLTAIEREITARDLPATVAQLLRLTYPRATYRIVEEVTTVSGATETPAFYELLLVNAKKQRLEVQVALDGSRILKEERKKAGDPND